MSDIHLVHICTRRIYITIGKKTNPQSAVWGAVCFRSSWERVVTDVRDRPPEWTFESNGTDSSRRLFQKSVRAGRGGRAVDGWPWRAAGVNFWNKRNGFLTPIVSEVCQSGPWTASRDGLLGWTFETNSMDSSRRFSVSEVFQSGPWGRAVDGRPWRAAGMDFWNKRHRFLASIVAEVRQSGLSEPWRAAEMNFWNKRHGFLAPISKVYQIGPWEQAVDGRPWRAMYSFFSQWNKKIIGAFPDL